MLVGAVGEQELPNAISWLMKRTPPKQNTNMAATTKTLTDNKFN